MWLRWAYIVLVGIVLLSPCMAESPKSEAPLPIEAFDSNGYTGAWVQVPGLEMEFFLPVGWVEIEPEGDAAYTAVNAEHTASLNITMRDSMEDGETLSEWAQRQYAQDGEYTVKATNGQEVAVLRGEATLTVLVPFEEGHMVCFQFERDSEEALSDALALAIAGTVEYYWA